MYKRQAKIEYELLLRYKDALEQGQSARTVIPQNDDEEQCAKQMFLLTTKPVPVSYTHLDVYKRQVPHE